MERSFLINDGVSAVWASHWFEEFTLIDFDGVVNFLKQVVPIDTIYNLSRNRHTLDLIVVLDRSCGEALDTFENVLDMSLLGYKDSICTLHTFGHLNQQILEGHLFYSSACIEDNVVYRKTTARRLPSPSPQRYEDRKAHLNYLFKLEMEKACSFFEGASHFIKLKRHELAVFMLQQAVELTYRCFLNLMRGKDIKCHTLYVLRRNIRRFAPELVGVFSANEEEELFYLALLEKAYCDARYNREYKAEKDMVILLYQKVWQLHSRAFDLFASLMLRIEREIIRYGATIC